MGRREPGPGTAARLTPAGVRRAPSGAVAALGIAVVASVIGLLRIPLGLYDVAWAEDANVFAKEAVDSGAWAVAFRGYAGYQHLVPRIVMALVLPGGLAPMAVLVAIVSVLLAGAAAGAVFWLSRDVVAWLPARVVLGLITVLLPLVGHEVLGNLANLHTFCFWVLLFVIFCRFRSWAAANAWAVVGFICVLTEVQSLVLLLLIPFLLLRRDRKTLPLVGALIAGSAVQIVTVATVTREARPQLIDALSLLQGWLINTVFPMVNADAGSTQGWLRASGLTVPILALIPFAVAVGIVLWRGSSAQRVLVVTLCALSLVTYAAGAMGNGSALYRYSEPGLALWERGLNARYGVLSAMTLAATVPLATSVVALSTRLRARATVRKALAWSALIGLSVVFAVGCMRTTSQRELVGGPWSPSIVGSTRFCAGMDPGAEIPFPVAPDRVVFFRCGSLRAFAADYSAAP